MGAEYLIESINLTETGNISNSCPNAVEECDHQAIIYFQALHDLESSTKQNSISKTTVNIATSDFAGHSHSIVTIFKRAFDLHPACIDHI